MQVLNNIPEDFKASCEANGINPDEAWKTAERHIGKDNMSGAANMYTKLKGDK